MFERFRRWMRPTTADFAASPPKGEAAASVDGRDLTRGYIQPNQRAIPADRVLNLESYRGLTGYDLYRDLLADWEVMSKLQQRRLALVSAETEVIAGGDKRLDKKAAEFVEDLLEHIGWDRITGTMHYGIFYGFAVAECLWTTDGAYIVPDAIKTRDRRRFCFDGAGRLRLLTQQNPLDGELLPERKFWAFQTGADHDDEPYGIGLAHWLYWPVTFKRGGIKFWLVAAEKFGSPTAAANFPPGTSEADQAKLLSTLQSIRTDSAVIFPQGIEAELLEAKRASGVDYETLCSAMDQAINKIILSQMAPADSTANKLNVSSDEPPAWQRLVKADADLICESFNRSVVQWLIDWNFPGAAYPKVWRRTEPPEDLGKRSEIERRIFDMGYRPTLQQIEDEYDGEWEVVPQAQPQAQPLDPSQPQSGESSEQPPADGEDGADFAAATEDPLAGLLSDAMAKAGSHPFDPATLRAIVKAATSQQDLESRLLTLFNDPAHQREVFRSTLALAEFAGQVLGYVNAEEEAA